MKTLKKALGLLLALSLAFSVAACGSPASSQNAGNGAGTGQSTANGGAASGALDTSERVDLVFYVMGDAPKDELVVEEAINEKLLEKLNATIDFQFSTWTDFTQKYNNQLTSGGADLIYIANWLNYGLLANSGAFVELDEMLDQYTPELKEAVGESYLDMCRVNGNVYAIPATWAEYVPQGIMYREDLREKYDLPRPDSIENMEAFFKGIKDNEPNQGILRVAGGESQGLQQGFDIASVLGIKYKWVGNGGLSYGLTANYDTPSDVYDYWFSEDFVEDAKLFKRWADMGFWSKSAISDTNDSEAYDNGLCVAMVAGQNPNKQIAAMTNFAKTHPDWKTEYIAYGEITGVMYPGHATQNGTAIVRGSKNPERALAVLSYFMTDEEMNRLVQAGIEGKHYELVDGMYKNLSEDFKYEGFNTWDLRNSEYKMLQESDVVLQEMFDRYEAIGEKTKFPNVNIPGGFVEDYTEYETERTAVSNVIKQYLAPLQAGMVKDVDAAVAEFREKVTAAGLEKCQEGYTKQWLAYCEEYGYK